MRSMMLAAAAGTAVLALAGCEAPGPSPLGATGPVAAPLDAPVEAAPPVLPQNPFGAPDPGRLAPDPFL
ncbi:hypothetical protein BH23PSE1_BH23PSE1_12410 [soil metagenome]